MAERQAFIDRIKGAERESNVITSAIGYYKQMIEVERARLPVRASLRDLVKAAENVESTY